MPAISADVMADGKRARKIVREISSRRVGLEMASSDNDDEIMVRSVSRVKTYEYFPNIVDNLHAKGNGASANFIDESVSAVERPK